MQTRARRQGAEADVRPVRPPLLQVRAGCLAAKQKAYRPCCDFGADTFESERSARRRLAAKQFLYLNADSDAASEIPRRWRIPADLHGAGRLFSRPSVLPAVTRHGGHANTA